MAATAKPLRSTTDPLSLSYSLHNTAKIMENNPMLLRLKELEALEQVTQRIDKISVYGGLDGVLNDLVKLRPQ